MQRRTSLQVSQESREALRRNKKSITEVLNNFSSGGRQKCNTLMIDRMEDQSIQEVLVLSHALAKKVSFQDSHSTITSENSPEHLLGFTAISLRKKESSISAQNHLQNEIISENEICLVEGEQFGQSILHLQHFRNSLARIITEQQ